MFSENQVKALSHDLDESRVKTIEKAGMSFKYLETYDVINAANNIFNYMWDYTVSRLDQVANETNQNGNYVITYSAIVKVRIYDAQRNFIEREDVGAGIGTAKTLGDAIDIASKSAVSDSLKRSLRTMGRQFANDLYSKEPLKIQQHPTSNPQQYAPKNHFNSSYSPREFQSLYNLGLQVLEKGNNFVVIGEDIFNKKDSIKACGFRWDGGRKLWYRSMQEAA